MVICIFDANTKNNVKVSALIVKNAGFQNLFSILIAKDVCCAKEQAHAG